MGEGAKGRPVSHCMVARAKIAAMIDRGTDSSNCGISEHRDKQSFSSFISATLSYDPSLRMTPREGLLHPFLASISIAPLLLASPLATRDHHVSASLRPPAIVRGEGRVCVMPEQVSTKPETPNPTPRTLNCERVCVMPEQVSTKP